jgi:hypothetical protein
MPKRLLGYPVDVFDGTTPALGFDQLDAAEPFQHAHVVGDVAKVEVELGGDQFGAGDAFGDQGEGLCSQLAGQGFGKLLVDRNWAPSHVV